MKTSTRHHNVRVRSLQAWMALQGTTPQEIAGKMGVSPQFLTSILISGKRRMPPARRAQLLDLGLPEHLLPDPGDSGTNGEGLDQQPQQP